MSSASLILSVFLIIISAVSVNSVCLQGQVVGQLTKYGTADTQCIFKNMKVLPGSSFKLPSPDCLECKCTAKSMTCCGFGFTAGAVSPPAGCVAHNDACKLIFVKQGNQTEVCKPTKGAASSKKKPTAPAHHKSKP